MKKYVITNEISGKYYKYHDAGEAVWVNNLNDALIFEKKYDPLAVLTKGRLESEGYKIFMKEIFESER